MSTLCFITILSSAPSQCHRPPLTNVLVLLLRLWFLFVSWRSGLTCDTEMEHFLASSSLASSLGIRVTEVRVEILVQNLCRLLAEVASFPPGERGIMSTDRSSMVSISRYTIKGYYRRSVYFHQQHHCKKWLSSSVFVSHIHKYINILKSIYKYLRSKITKDRVLFIYYIYIKLSVLCLWLKREQISANMVLFYAWSHLILIYFSKNPVLKIQT